MGAANAFESGRNRMVREQLHRSGVTDERVLHAFRTIPREAFVPWFKRRLAYLPTPLGIGFGQTISQPRIVARMLELAALRRDDRVLDVGAGSGYLTALLAQLCASVYGIEIVPMLAERANQALRSVGIANAVVQVGNGHEGLPKLAPFDAIFVSAAAPEIPAALLDQLKDGGRLIMPVGPHLSRRELALGVLLKRPSPQRLVRVTRRGTHFEREDVERVYFVPFIAN